MKRLILNFKIWYYKLKYKLFKIVHNEEKKEFIYD